MHYTSGDEGCCTCNASAQHRMVHNASALEANVKNELYGILNMSLNSDDGDGDSGGERGRDCRNMTFMSIGHVIPHRHVTATNYSKSE